MKRILLIAVTVLLSVSTLFSLEPLKVAYYTTSTGVQTVHVEIKDYSSGSTLFVGENFSLTPNSNGIVIVNIQDHIGPNGDLSGINASTINTSVTVDVYVGTTLHSQHRLDNLIFDQASTTVFDNSGNFNPPTTNSSLGTDPNRWEDAFVGSNTLHVGPNNGMTGGTEMTLSYDEVNNKGVIAIDGTTSFEAKTTGITIPNLSGVGNRNLGVDANGNIVINTSPSVTAGDGLTLSTNTLNVVGSNTIIANANDVEVNSSGTANQVLLSSGTVGTAATYGALPLGDANAVSGTLPVARGGTGATTLTTGNFLQGNGTGAVTATKAVPTGAVVGTTDAQTLTNKNIDANSNTITNIFPDQTGNSGNYLTTNGANVSWGSIPAVAFTVDAGNNKVYRNDPDDDFIFGDDDFDWSSGFETKMYFNKSKGAFRMGRVENTNWDNGVNIGNFSAAMGRNTIASGLTSFAFGNLSEASGLVSIAMGFDTEANAGYSTAMGFLTIADANNSVAMGKYNDNTITGELLTIGNGASNSVRSNAFEVYESGDVVVGSDLTVSNLSGTGNRNIGVDANGKLIELAGGGGGAFTSAGGQTTINNLSDDFIVGEATLNHGSGFETKMFFDDSRGAFRAGAVENNHWNEDSLGLYSFASGYHTRATGNYSVAMGDDNLAAGSNSVAMGTDSEAKGSTSFAFGSSAEARGGNSVAIGTGSTTDGDLSTSIGALNLSNGDYSTTMGFGTHAEGDYSMAFGNSTRTDGDNSTTFGLNTKAESYNEFVIGNYDTDYTPDNTTGLDVDDRLFVIGNGTSSSARSDAMIVYKSGDTEINGDVTISNLAGGGTQNLQVDNTGKIITGGGGGGGGGLPEVTVLKVTSDYTVTSITYENITGLNTTLDANSVYQINGVLKLDGTFPDEFNLKLDGLPSSGTIFLESYDYVSNDRMMITTNEFSYDFELINTEQNLPIEGIFETSSSGTFNMQLRKLDDDFIVESGSFIILTKIK